MLCDHNYIADSNVAASQQGIGLFTQVLSIAVLHLPKDGDDGQRAMHEYILSSDVRNEVMLPFTILSVIRDRFVLQP
jgi:hypothetical protein